MLCTAQSSATASLVAVRDTAQNAVSVDHKHLSTESLHSLPWGREQDSFTSAAYQMEMSTNLEEMRWSLSGFATACLFSPACLYLLRGGSVCTSCFWRAELRYCLLNAELCRIWTSFRNCTRKKIHCYYFEMLFVPMPNPAGFIYIRLIVTSLFSANPTTWVFFVFPQLDLQLQFTNKHKLARAVYSKGVSPCLSTQENIISMQNYKKE